MQVAMMMVMQLQNQDKPSVTTAAPLLTTTAPDPLTSFGTVPSPNDNSNPQQGTGGVGGSIPQSTDNIKKMIEDNSQNQAEPRIVSSAEEMMAQQSAAVPPESTNKPNGHMKDVRKLFVGGLPTDSECVYL